MKITKLGHCCMLIGDKGKVILTDPGAWTTAQNNVRGVDLVLITHEHPDHFHLESLKTVLANNPKAQVVTNSRVGSLLEKEGIAYKVVEDSQEQVFDGIPIAGFGTEHAMIYPTVPNVMNTGYLIERRFFYPGDALTDPNTPVDILAMPIAGPWLTLAQAIDWVKAVQPHVCIPVHDGMLQPRQWIYRYPTQLFAEAGIKFDAIEPGESREY